MAFRDSGMNLIYTLYSRADINNVHTCFSVKHEMYIYFIFDHLIKPIKCYACEIWGPCKINIHESCYQDNYWKQVRANVPIESKMYNTTNLFEKLHIKLCRCILGVNNKTSNVGIYGELGR